MLIKNAIVEMDWDAEGFYETRNDGFVAAVNIYTTSKGEYAVMFKDGVAFMIFDDDTQAPATRAELRSALKQVVDDAGAEANMEEYFPDCFIELCTGADVDPDLAEMYGFSEEDCKDISDRLTDLSGYIDITVEDMV